jgi:hypothetical protein
MKLLSTVIACSLILGASARAENAPEEISRETYGAWLESIGSVVSPYQENLFDWLDEQNSRALPREVQSDPEHLFVTVERPLQETIEAEEMGDVEKGVTYGLETYAVIDAPVDTVLETILFRWGKPVGAVSGVTYPVDSVFSFREEKLEPFWGERSYRCETKMRGGGVAKDQNDISSLLVRGNAEEGYILVGNFFGPNGSSPSTSSLSIMLLRPLEDGRTEYRVSGRYTGQSYSFFGIEFGRKNYGFNATRIRAGQKEFFAQVAELKNTGKITERRPR